MHKTLNQKLFDSDKLREDVRQKLLDIATAFAKTAHIESFIDVIVTGSNVNLNYTSKSDLDLHLIVDATPTELDFFNAQKTIWNLTQKITIKNYPVEVYVQGKGDVLIAAGQYSLTRDTWLSHPVNLKTNAELAKQVKAEADKYERVITDLIAQDADEDCLECYKTKIREFRKAGLVSSEGEQSFGNLLFKELRHRGVFDRMDKFVQKKKDMELSLMSEQERKMRKLFNDVILMKIENKMIDMLEVHYPQPTSKKVSSLEEILADHVFWEKDED